MLVEGEKGVLQCHSYFGEDDFSLAVIGSSISQTQMKTLIFDLAVEEVIIGFDKMYKDIQSFEAEIYRNKLYKKVQGFLPYCKVSILWDFDNLLEYKQSPTDYGKNVLIQMLEKRVEVELHDEKSDV